MVNISLHKVNSLPEVLAPSTMYFLKDDTTGYLTIYLSDALGQVAYRAETAIQDSEAFQSALEGLINTPGGIAGLTEQGYLSAKIDGQDTPILIDDNDYVWKDNVSTFIIRAFTGGNNPTFGTIIGNIQGLLFSPSTMNQVWCDYHIDHDIALNTAVYPHVHWCPLSNASGVVRWGIDYTIAKGHGQQAFSQQETIYINHYVPPGSNLVHMVSESSDLQAILSDRIEPDAVVKMRVFRDANHVNDTYPGRVHGWMADLHYRVARIGTRNKAPNFFLP